MIKPTHHSESSSPSLAVSSTAALTSSSSNIGPPVTSSFLANCFSRSHTRLISRAPRAKRGCDCRISQAAWGVNFRALLVLWSMVLMLSLRGDVTLLAEPAGDDRLTVK